MFNIVLVEPEIPQNTGNIARTCAATGCALHLVRPLGFEVTDKYLKRAGLDYWSDVEIFYYDSIEELFEKFPSSRFFSLPPRGAGATPTSASKRATFWFSARKQRVCRKNF